MTLTCDTCRKVYKTERGYNNHRQKGCNTVIKKLSNCSLCNISFETPLELHRHMELDICSKFLRNNTYCYTCHIEFGVHELLVQHEFTDEHLDRIRSGYSDITPLSNVKNELRNILRDGTIQETEIFPVTIEENKIQEELFEIEEALREEEIELEKAEKKAIKLKEKEGIKLAKKQEKEEEKLKRQKEKEKQKEERQQKFNKMLKKGIRMKNKNKEEIKTADISSFFQFQQQPPKKDITISQSANKLIKKTTVNISKVDNSKPKKTKLKPPKLEFDANFNYEFMGDTESEEEFTEINMDKPSKNKKIESNNKPDIKELNIIEPVIKEPVIKEPVKKSKTLKIRKDDPNTKINNIENIETVNTIIEDNNNDLDIKTITVSNIGIKNQKGKIKKTSVVKENTISKISLENKKNKNDSVIEIKKLDESIPVLNQNNFPADSINIQNNVPDVISKTNEDTEIVQYYIDDRFQKRDEFYKKIREQRQEKDIVPYKIGKQNEVKMNYNYDGVYNLKKYIDTYSINSLKLYQKIMSEQPKLPYVYNPSDEDKLNSGQMKDKINSILGERQQMEHQFQDTFKKDESLLNTQKVIKSSRNTFGDDYSLQLKNRNLLTKEIYNHPKPETTTLKQIESDTISQGDFQKKMNEIKAFRDSQDLLLKDVVKKQKIDDKLHGQEDIMAVGNNGSSYDMDQYQNPNKTEKQDLSSIMGMFDAGKINQQTRQPHVDKHDDFNDLEKELSGIGNNVNKFKPPTNNDSHFDNQKSALDNLLGPSNDIPDMPNPGKVRAPPVSNNNITIDIEPLDTEEFDLGNELKQVSVELEKIPKPEKPKVTYEDQMEKLQKFQKENEEHVKMMHAKQLDSSIKNPVWILCQKIINENNIDRNMMNILVNCRVEDYVVIHKFINMSNQLKLETEKQKKLIKIFKNFVKFLGKKLKNNEYIIQGKNVKYMLDTLKPLKF